MSPYKAYLEPLYSSSLGFNILGSFYAAAQNACRISKAHLLKLKLSDEEQKLLSAPPKAEDLKQRLKDIGEVQERQLKKSKMGQISSEFVNRFCDVAIRTSGIVEILLPQSPEYTVTYGLLIILFKVCLLLRLLNSGTKQLFSQSSRKKIAKSFCPRILNR